jgi:hypothetical protein
MYATGRYGELCFVLPGRYEATDRNTFRSTQRHEVRIETTLLTTDHRSAPALAWSLDGASKDQQGSRACYFTPELVRGTTFDGVELRATDSVTISAVRWWSGPNPGGT